MLPRSLRSLLSGIIDYAGMYPPAQLPFEEALKNYVEYDSRPYSWMVGQFVCPITKLSELRALDALYSHWSDLPLALIGSPATTLSELSSNCQSDFDEFTKFTESNWRPISYEFRIGPELAREKDLASAVEAVVHASPADVVFCEIPILELTDDTTAGAIDAIAAVEGCATKLRLGGASADAIPSTELLAFAIERLAWSETTVKFTAGLHQPLCQADPALGARMHGFLNVFCASVLACAHRLERQTIEAILMESDPAQFVFDDAGLRVGSISATMSQIETGRTFAVGFGSCSVLEPVEGLVALGYTLE